MNKQQAIEQEIISNLKRYFGRGAEDATLIDVYNATALCLRNDIMEKKYAYEKEFKKAQGKELFYLSFEFLLGKSLKSNLVNMGLSEVYEKALSSLGYELEQVARAESDAGLGNGGLGRLAACFMDSLATCRIPSYGCSIRYEYGLFKQKIVDGYQTELPDKWLENGSAWEIPRPDEKVTVKFGGDIKVDYSEGRLNFFNEGAAEVLAIPYDVPVTGYDSEVVNTLRLWRATSPNDLDFKLFSGGDYLRAVEQRNMAEALSKVLYPEDNHTEGKALRLRQQYFFASATLQWLISRHKKKYSDLSTLPEKVVIHINDTHPAVAIPEMMRILMDEEGMQWEQAYDITARSFAYTNHTIMNEALEKWPVETFKSILPRVYMIVEELNNRLVERLKGVYGEDWGKISYMAIISNGYINMANLSIASGFAVNGVSALHTEILKNDVFRDYYELEGHKFHSITNGISFRRWLKEANPKLDELILSAVGEDFASLEKYLDDKAFLNKLAAIKKENKKKLAEYILEHNGINVDVDSIFDVQVKRLHEYKRQLLCVFHILYLYNEIKDGRTDVVPRTFIFGAKASPGYKTAKLIIKLINTVAELVNGDAAVSKYLRVVFIENYGVSIAEKIIAAADVSEQISTAGKEASGTGNMKFMLNGAVTVGTLDGANVEMLEQAGEENIYIFGLRAHEVTAARREDPYRSRHLYTQNAKLKRVVDMLIDGSLNHEEPRLFYDLYHSLVVGDGYGCDTYMLLQDFESYIDVQSLVSKDFTKKTAWLKKSLKGIANAKFFSSDRTVEQYNKMIWNVEKFDKRSL